MGQLESIISFLRRKSQTWIFFLAIALVAGIGFVDYITGYEVTVFPFYSIPILLALWFGNQHSAIAISIFSTIAWWGADTASGHVYSREWLQLWDTVVRWMFFGLVIFAGTAVRLQRNASRARVALLERLHLLEQEIIHISEQERQRIGRDLHDGVCQYLAAIGFTTGLLKSKLEKVSPTHARIAGDVCDLLHDAMIRTRDLSRGLSPIDPDERGLESALGDLASTTSRLMEISCTFHCPEPVSVEANAVSVHLFRITQEALNNATQHGHAHSILIALQEAEGKLSLTVSDDGEGFVPPPVDKRGIGLHIMAYRARSIGGILKIQQNSPTGTIVSCTIDQTTTADLTPDLMPYE